MKEFAPELAAKMSVAIGTVAIAAVQKMAPDHPVQFLEMVVAGAGGVVAGFMLLRFADPGLRMSAIDKLYTVAFSSAIAAFVGPPFANFCGRKGWIDFGFWENGFAGVAMGAIVPLSFGAIIFALRWGQRHPDKIIDLARDLWPWGRRS